MGTDPRSPGRSVWGAQRRSEKEKDTRASGWRQLIHAMRKSLQIFKRFYFFRSLSIHSVSFSKCVLETCMFSSCFRWWSSNTKSLGREGYVSGKGCCRAKMFMGVSMGVHSDGTWTFLLPSLFPFLPSILPSSLFLFFLFHFLLSMAVVVWTQGLGRVRQVLRHGVTLSALIPGVLEEPEELKFAKWSWNMQNVVLT